MIAATPHRSLVTLALWSLVAALPVLAKAQAPSPYRIYDTAAEREVNLSQVAARLAPADVVFWGEEHDDSLGHVLQDSLYGMLLERYGEVTLSMEMFEADVQPVLDEYLAGLVPLDRLRTDARAWDNYPTDYAPLVERAKIAGQPVIAANAPRRYVSLVGQRGTGVLEELPKASRSFLPKRPYRYIDTAYQARFNALMGGMGGHGAPSGKTDSDAAALSPFFAAQMLWDATMASNIKDAYRARRREDAKVLHLAGGFHVEYGQGTVAQLRARAKRLALATVLAVTVEEVEAVDWGEYEERADFVVVSEGT